MTGRCPASFERPFLASRRLAALLVVLLWPAAPALARQAAPDLGKATLEELMNMQVVSVSRKDQRMVDSAAAVYVITQDDIRRSGLTTVPDLLRLAPGVQVARIDANKWAIAVRGFNSRWSNKLLVLVDGRTVYNRLLSGVYWDMINIPPRNIDRIEVVRGPGGSVWGANAVDGVINILTKSAAATRGGLVSVGAGQFGAANAAASYSAGRGRLAYRVDANGLDLGYGRLPGSTVRGGDDSHNVGAGLRLDWTGARTDLTVEGGTTNGRSSTRTIVFLGPIPPVGGWQPSDEATAFSDTNLRLQLTRRAGTRSSIHAEAYVDQLDRRDPQTHHHAVTADMDLEYQTARGRHEFVAGAASRTTGDRFDGYFGQSLVQPDERLTVFNLFAQDELVLAADRLRLTFGSKIEHDTVSHWDFQPTVRALFKISPAQRVWAAVSRAVRTPSRADRGVRAVGAAFLDSSGLPVVLEFDGSPNVLSEAVRTVEAGYRASVGRRLTFDLAGFASANAHVVTVETQAAELRADAGRPYLLVPQIFANNLSARTEGLEGTAQWQPTSRWFVQGSLSTFREIAHPGVTTDPAAVNPDGAAPGWQGQIRAGYSGARVDLGATLSAVGAIRTRAIPAYTRVDVHGEWRVTGRLAAGLTGQNLIGSGHLEFGGTDNFATPTVSSRTWLANLTWRF